MHPMHPELRKGLAEEHIRRLSEDMRAPMSAGRVWQLAARLLLAASRRHAEEPASVQASSASLTSLSASSLSSRRTAVYETDPSSRPRRAA
jgi:hypothetical protein